MDRNVGDPQHIGHFAHGVAQSLRQLSSRQGQRSGCGVEGRRGAGVRLGQMGNGQFFSHALAINSIFAFEKSVVLQLRRLTTNTPSSVSPSTRVVWKRPQDAQSRSSALLPRGSLENGIHEALRTPFHGFRRKMASLPCHPCSGGTEPNKSAAGCPLASSLPSLGIA